MECKNCSQEMFRPGGDAIEWACSWCGHTEWFAEWLAKHPRNPAPRATDGFTAVPNSNLEVNQTLSAKAVVIRHRG